MGSGPTEGCRGVTPLVGELAVESAWLRCAVAGGDWLMDTTRGHTLGVGEGLQGVNRRG